MLRTQFVGWEFDERAPTLGAGVAADVIGDYAGESHRVELLAFDGSRNVLEALAACGWGCEMVADLAPTGSWLVSARTDGTDDRRIEIVAIDHRSGTAQLRTTIPIVDDTTLHSIDTADERSLVLTAGWSPAWDVPQLGHGDRGPWVQALQTKLSVEETYLVPDGEFGPRTEAAVRAVQIVAGHEATGVVDTATWELLGGPYRVLNEPILVEPDGSVRVLPVLTRSTPLMSYGNEPRITLWSGPEWPGAADAGR